MESEHMESEHMESEHMESEHMESEHMESEHMELEHTENTVEEPMQVAALSLEDILKQWENQVRYVQLQNAILQMNFSILPVVVACPHCKESFRVDIPLGAQKQEEQKVQPEAPIEEPIVEDPAAKHMCKLCGKPYKKADGSVRPLWEYLDICSESCWLEING